MRNWVFSWVQIAAHNKIKLILFWLILLLIALGGFNYADVMVAHDHALLLAVAFLLMAVVTGYLLESFKIALIQFSLSFCLVLMTLGFNSWFGISLVNETLLGLVVLMTVVSSNLIHVLTTLSREMARGLFQFDAIAEAIKLNHMPILLSNLTTALGFTVAAFMEPSLIHLAILVVTGCLLAYLIILMAIPVILLNWLLEFRVGNSADRHGMSFVWKALEQNKRLRLLIFLVTFIVLFAVFSLSDIEISFMTDIFAIGCVFLILFWWAYKRFALAVFNVVTCVLVLLMSLLVFTFFLDNDFWLWTIWVIPLGIIVDDTIHFFTRYVRAQQQFFNEPKSAIKYAMTSVGRAIWITSWVLLSGLAVLLLSSVEFVWQSAVLTMTSIVLTTYMIIILFPALFMAHK